ncbi:EscU/YscU/HrcU family type III secretion system export apparatus switch protein [bacterium]|nr:MAG: EscU/YscU/HrcU family type III secretion system export apparatus switch protein [bacterium]
MAGDGAEKTEKPTERRMREARKRGQIPKSQDLVGAASVLVLVSLLPKVVTEGGNALIGGLRASMGAASLQADQAEIVRSAAAVGGPIALPFALLAGAAMFTGVAATLAQVGLNLSAEGMIPKFERVNPLAGIKRVIGKQGLFECAKSLVKAVVFAFLAFSAVRARWPELLMLGALPLPQALSVIGDVIHGLLMRIGGAWLVLAAVDYGFQRKQVMSQLMMTKDEVRQEMKDAEASPELKGHRNQLRKKMAKRKVAQAVQGADVIVTNPTHFSVAIKYDASKSHAPVVVAKGVDHLAFRIRELAAEHKIPIVPNPPLARALYKQCEIDDFVPRELFGPVAEVLAYVYRTIGRTK